MLMDVTTWFLVFMIYSTAGWVMEVFVTILQHKHFVNRGFLVGPICPIYGCGALLLLFLLQNTDNIFVVFLVSMIGGSALEYVVSVVMERLFRVRWWDYSKYRFNFHGRICLRSTLCFGFLGVIIKYLTTPALLTFFDYIPETFLLISAGFLLLALLIDIATSLWLILGVRVTVGILQNDATEEITERVREILMNKSRLNRRLVKAFPSQSAKTQHQTKKRRRSSGSAKVAQKK